MSWCPAEPPAGKGGRPSAEGAGVGESKFDPVRPGRPRGAEPGPPEPDLNQFYTSGRGSLGYVAPQAQLEASQTGYLPQLGGTEVPILISPPNPHTHRKTLRPLSPPRSLSEPKSRGPSFAETRFLHFGNSGMEAGSRSVSVPPPPPSRTWPLPSDNAKAASGTGWSAEAACPGRRSLPARRRHAWGGTQGARTLNSPASKGWGGA